MTRDDFWKLNAGLPPEDAAEELQERLLKLTPEEVHAYRHRFDEVVDEAYTWSLWGAAYLIDGGCSDDGFAYFRSGLVSRGREVFEAALADPDSLASLEPEEGELENEEFGYVAAEVYQEMTGEELPLDPPTGIAATAAPAEPVGEAWDFDDAAEMAARFPQLWKTFGW